MKNSGVHEIAARLTKQLRRVEALAEPTVAGDAAKRLSVLEGVSVFFMQPKSVVRSLARESRQVTVKNGDVLVRRGTPNESLFVVMRGQFAAVVETPDGDSLPIAMLGPMDVFGVLSLVSSSPAAATVMATSDGEVLVIDGHRLVAQLDEHGSTASQLQRVAAQRQALLEGAKRRTRVPTGTGSLTAVYSPKGGAGKTTLALHLCAALAARHPADVVLLDMGLPYNDAALVSGQVPTTCLARAVDIDANFEELLLSSALHHPAQFFLLPVVLKPEEADLITPEVVARTVETLRREFKYVVVDCSVQLSDQVLAVLERAQHVVVITTPRLASLKDVAPLLDILQNVLHVPAGRIHLTVNHTASRAPVGRDEIERIVGRRTAVDIRYDAAAERAAIEGELLTKVRPSGPVATGAGKLAARINGRPVLDHGSQLAGVAKRLFALRRRVLA